MFDTLRARDQIRVHPNERERAQALAQAAPKAIAAGTPAVVTADTREQVATFNDLIPERLVVAGRVDDEHTTITSSGQRIGAADLVATRRNDADLDVANRDTWTVMHVGSDGHVTVAGEYRQRMLPAGYVREHVELAYARTARERVTALLAEPTLRVLAGDRIESERDTWRVERDVRERDRYARVVPRAADRRVQPSAHEHDTSVSPRAPDQSPSMGR